MRDKIKKCAVTSLRLLKGPLNPEFARDIAGYASKADGLPALVGNLIGRKLNNSRFTFLVFDFPDKVGKALPGLINLVKGCKRLLCIVFGHKFRKITKLYFLPRIPEHPA